MFSSLPNLIDRAFIIGFQLPVLVFLAAITLLLNPSALDRIAVAKITEQTVGFSLVIAASWLIAVLLLIGNYWIYRLLEGYAGPFKRENWREMAKHEWQAARDRLEALSQQNHSDPRQQALFDHEWVSFLQRYPNRKELVLPTRFGNAIRSFESYAFSVYGADSIPIWPRLLGVIPASFVTTLNDARSQVDFFVNCCFLAIATALGAAAFALYKFALCPGYEQISMPLALGTAAFAPAISWICYEAALRLVPGWGDIVKSAFDLYLPALAKQLGYQLPELPEQSMEFWRDSNAMFLYWQPMEGKWPKVKPEQRSGTGGQSDNPGPRPRDADSDSPD